MTINNRNLSILRKVVEAGYVDEKTISGLSAEDMVGFCKDLRDIKAVIELQKAIKSGAIIAFLTSKEG